MKGSHSLPSYKLAPDSPLVYLTLEAEGFIKDIYYCCQCFGEQQVRFYNAYITNPTKDNQLDLPEIIDLIQTLQLSTYSALVTIQDFYDYAYGQRDSPNNFSDVINAQSALSKALTDISQLTKTLPRLDFMDASSQSIYFNFYTILGVIDYQIQPDLKKCWRIIKRIENIMAN